MSLPYLPLTAPGDASEAFRKKGIVDFAGAADLLRRFPYKRNRDKHNLCTVLSDAYGTCSTKHALLRQLAIEQGWEEVRLMLGLFKMNAINTPPVARTLEQYHLPYMPEAHCYLRIDGTIWDGTTKNSSEENFVHDLLLEREIEPAQIAGFKVNWHKDFLKQWLSQGGYAYTPEQLFAIREQCIKDLENAS